MITGIILSFFGASCFASVVVFAACAASARADQIQQEAFSSYYDEVETISTESHRGVAAKSQLALNT